jgi:hypothetical protein
MLQTITYQDYIRSERWHVKKGALYRHRRYRCRFCNCRQNLEAHHITYANLGREPLYDLVYLCPRHHEFVHGLFGGWYRTVLKVNRLVEKYAGIVV